MNNLETALKALADKNRLRIVKLLQHRNMCVCELADILEITQPSVSRHLNKLKSAGLISSKQDGLWTNYFLKEADTLYGRILISNIKEWLNNDKTIVTDLKKATTTDRNKLCNQIKKN